MATESYFTIASITMVQCLKIPPAFSEKYPKETVIKWFNKDNKGYAAFFVSNNVKKIVIFNNDGTFLKEQVKNEQHGQHDDNDVEEGSECEID